MRREMILGRNERGPTINMNETAIIRNERLPGGTASFSDHLADVNPISEIVQKISFCILQHLAKVLNE